MKKVIFFLTVLLIAVFAGQSRVEAKMIRPADFLLINSPSSKVFVDPSAAKPAVGSLTVSSTQSPQTVSIYSYVPSPFTITYDYYDNVNSCAVYTVTLSTQITWSKTPSLIGQWAGDQLIFLGAEQIGPNPNVGPNVYQGSVSPYPEEEETGCIDPQDPQEFLQEGDNAINSDAYEICDYFTPNNSTVPQLLCSGNALVVDPALAPASYNSTNSVNSNNQTRTPDPVNIATGEAYFSSTDFSSK